jgi:hypothetical protein
MEWQESQVGAVAVPTVEPVTEASCRIHLVEAPDKLVWVKADSTWAW